MTAPARNRSRAFPTPTPPTTATATAPSPGGTGDPDNLSRDPFIRRLAKPAEAKKLQQSRRDIIEGLKVLDEQRLKAARADAMYEGDVGMVYASRQVRKLLAKQGLDETEIDDFNYAQIPVNVIADRLKIAAVKVATRVTEEEAEQSDGDDAGVDAATDGDDAASKKTVKKAERAVKAIRRANRLDVYEKSLHHNVSKHGDAYLFVWPVTDDRGKVVSVDMRVNTAHEVAVIYDREDPLQVSYVIKSWDTPSDIDDDTGEGRREVTRVNLYYPGERTIDADGEMSQGPGRIERWVTQVGASPGKADTWVKVHDPVLSADIEPQDLEEVAADEFGDPDDPLDRDDIASPFGLTWFHFRNGVPCGTPEHVNAYGPQMLINKLIWSYAGVVEYMGFPQRYMMVDPKIDDPMMNFIDPDSPDDEEDDPEGGGSSGLTSDPSALWKLYGKSTGQYTAADPDVFMKPLDRFITAMSELTGLPRYAFTKSTGDLPSGAAARELNSERDAKVKDRQDRYDPDWQDAYELALRMMGITGVAVDVRWEPVSAVNDMDGLNVLKAKAELGVPSDVLLLEAGYPDDLVDAWRASQEGLSIEQRITLLGNMGGAAQSLGAGVTAGIVSDNQTAAFIARIVEMLAVGTKDPERGPDSLPEPEFRDPPPTDPAAAAAAAQATDPVKLAQADHIGAQAEHTRVQTEHAKTIGVEAAKAGVEATRAGVESTRAGTEMMKKNAQNEKPGNRPAGSAR